MTPGASRETIEPVLSSGQPLMVTEPMVGHPGGGAENTPNKRVSIFVTLHHYSIQQICYVRDGDISLTQCCIVTKSCIQFVRVSVTA